MHCDGREYSNLYGRDYCSVLVDSTESVCCIGSLCQSALLNIRVESSIFAVVKFSLITECRSSFVTATATTVNECMAGIDRVQTTPIVVFCDTQMSGRTDIQTEHSQISVKYWLVLAFSWCDVMVL